jgi:RNA polymerase sigma-70 factor (ECF subfamily)
MNAAQRPETDDKEDLGAVLQVRAGHADAFSGIVSKYVPLLYSLAYRTLGADRELAEEAVQEIFLKAFKALPSFDIRKRFFPWLYTIAANHFRSIRRSRKRAKLRRVVPLAGAGPAQVPDGALRPDELALAREGERLAQGALDSLPDRLREVFLLRHVEGLSAGEVARILAVPETTVRTWVFRARALLKEKLLDSGWE